ncbi:hypothetical protein PRIPAC_93400 [Pristionchus pacificus]|uniref:Uncharacterized protein n=1 Tax=Pristionchus pacificus TaxID=54126 RepID=A0A2A6BR47_PRIPA|nr:hypothetical protein PRIPAC_93400 [Pristionchus pacificus]|eukprot:PDM68390.1 hypothetical protein PRIPAC_46434 [Pristionchus pacificus]
MQFMSYKSNKTMTRGAPFPCGLKHYLDEWKISDSFNYTMQPIGASKVVFESYSSSNHFNEARRGISAMRDSFKNKIIFYDLG